MISIIFGVICSVLMYGNNFKKRYFERREYLVAIIWCQKMLEIGKLFFLSFLILIL